MVKVFTKNKNGKIELTEKELESLLNESYWEGYNANKGTYIYHSPNNWDPYRWSITTAGSATNVTLTSNTSSSNAIQNDTITAETANLKA